LFSFNRLICIKVILYTADSFEKWFLSLIKIKTKVLILISTCHTLGHTCYNTGFVYTKKINWIEWYMYNLMDNELNEYAWHSTNSVTWALDCPTCSFLKRNCLFKLLTSMVSRSICSGMYKNMIKIIRRTDAKPDANKDSDINYTN